MTAKHQVKFDLDGHGVVTDDDGNSVRTPRPVPPLDRVSFVNGLRTLEAHCDEHEFSLIAYLALA